MRPKSLEHDEDDIAFPKTLMSGRREDETKSTVMEGSQRGIVRTS